MPNHCTCHVTVIGHKEDIDEFAEHQLSFQHFVPRPADADMDWHTWNVEHWGTKWEAWDYEEKIHEDNILDVEFVTAWAPPVAFFESLLLKYPRCWLKCMFNEESGSAGVWIGWVKAGTVKSKHMLWSEPEPVLTADGRIYISGSDEDMEEEEESSDYEMKNAE
jgi:hypothetical protein